ncbi:MAG TPA: type II secretion system F family protein, partial [Rariglobus sp.]
MPSFTYTARDRSGQTVSDVLDAPSRKDALRLLGARGLTPVQVNESASAGGKRPRPAAKTQAAPSIAAFSKSPQASSLTRRERLPFLE